MENKGLLLNRLAAYASSEAYPFHMPGHKRRGVDFPNPFWIDITEIDGFDNLHHPEGILKDSMKWAASVYGADRTWYLVNGSSCGILSAICTSVKNGGRILMSRNCHKSAYHGVILNRLKTSYVYPQIIPELGIQGGIFLDDVEKQLDRYPDTGAVLIVSPTYDGIVSDVEAIAEIVHKRNLPLIVDEAHGAHLPFGSRTYFPKSALECGADLVVQSLHKTLPSLTQTAMLHGNYGFVDMKRLEFYLQTFQSSSPSYVFMAAMERCVFEMDQKGRERMCRFGKRIRTMRERLSVMKHLRVLSRGECGNYGVFDVDESKLVVSARGCIRTGQNGKKTAVDGVWLADRLRKDYHLEMEMCGADYVTAILTCFDTEEGFSRLEKALIELDGSLEDSENETGLEKEWECIRFSGTNRSAFCREEEGKMVMADALDASWEEKPVEQCRNRISAEFIYLYPPGIPIIAPGEPVTDEVICKVTEYRRLKLPIQGMVDSDARMLRVVSDQHRC